MGRVRCLYLQPPNGRHENRNQRNKDKQCPSGGWRGVYFHAWVMAVVHPCRTFFIKMLFKRVDACCTDRFLSKFVPPIDDTVGKEMPS